MSASDRQFHVLVNAEEQFALFPALLPIPAGWTVTGFAGSKEECVRHVDTVWTDMRPRSLRAALDADLPNSARSHHG